MIIVSGEFAFEPGKDDEVRAAMIDVMNETAKEAGCIQYRFYRDVEHPDRYHVYEEWESKDHLKAHGASAHMATYRAALQAIGVKKRDVKMMETTGEPRQL